MDASERFDFFNMEHRRARDYLRFISCGDEPSSTIEAGSPRA